MEGIIIMLFTTLYFFAFLAACLIGYYVIPKKYRWIWLLIVSYAYYLSFGVKTAFFILYTTCTTYIGARIIGFFISDNKKKSIELNASISQYDKKESRKQLKIKILYIIKGVIF